MANSYQTSTIRKSGRPPRYFYIAVLLGLIVPSIVSAVFAVQLVSARAISLTQSTVPTEIYSQYGLGLVAAGIAVAGSCIGAGIAVHGAASAGLAAIVEKPESSTWVLILAGLGEGVAIYGLLIAILILGRLPAVS